MYTLCTPAQLARLEKGLAVKGKKLALYHRDADGIPSVALLKRFYPGFESVPREGPKLENKTVKELIQKKPALIVFLDLPVDEEWKKIAEMEKQLPETNIIVIDHHQILKDMNSEQTLHINPKFHQDAYLPTGYLMYRLLEKLLSIGKKKELKQLAWIAGVAVIGDHAYEECTDLLKECAKLDAGLVDNDVQKSKLFLGATLLSAAVTCEGLKGAEQAVGLLVGAERFGEMEKDKQLAGWRDKADTEFQKIVDGFGKKAEIHPEINLIFYEITSPLNLTSVTASTFSEKYPDHVVIIYKKSTDGYKVSARCQSGRINVGEMMKCCAAGIGLGGGHAKAAGGFVHDWREFETRVLDFLGV